MTHRAARIDSKEVQIEWEPANWFAATWRADQPLTKQPPRAFDTREAEANIDNFISKYIFDWSTVPCDLSLSTDEALFWFAGCFGKGLGDLSMWPELIAQARAGRGKISLDSMRVLLKKTRFDATRAHGWVPIQILDTLMSCEDLVQLLCESPTMSTVQTQYRKRVLPFLTLEGKKILQNQVQNHLGGAKWESEANFPYYMAACLGMHDVTESLVSDWSDAYGKQCDTRCNSLQLIVFGLGSAEKMVEHFQRLGLTIADREHAICWIAHTTDTQLETIWRCIRHAPFDANTDGMMKAIACIQSVPTAEFMFDRYFDADRSLQVIAADWLQRNPRQTIEALINISSREGKRGDNALAHLRVVRKSMGENVIRDVAATMPPHLVHRLNEEILQPVGLELPPFEQSDTPEWLAVEVAAQQKARDRKNLPPWLDVSDLPPVVIGERRLNAEHISALIQVLQKSTLHGSPPMARLLKAHADAGSVDRFCWALLDTWLRKSGASKENWAMFAVSFLGSDALAPRLAELIKVWPGESHHKRAIVGLECLRAMGSEVALMQINAISEKMKFKALKAKAEECMMAIAEARQLSRDRLSDRIIPTLGFDRCGARAFDYGVRQFVVTVGDDLKLVVTDQQGKERADLPPPSSADNPDMAKEASAEWKGLKKAVRDLKKVQAERLEHAMVLSRRWFTDEFVNFLFNHPLMRPLLCQLVWSGFNMMGQMNSSFAIYDLRKADIQNGDGKSVDINSFAEIGLLHPLQLSDDDLAKWRTDFAKRKVKQPFQQLDRAVQRLSEKEKDDIEVLRIRKCSIQATAIVGILDRHGWQRGPVMDGGLFTEHIKYFPCADLTAVIRYEGIPVGTGGVGWDDQHIDYCAFLPGKVAGEYDRESETGLRLGTVDPIVLSEVLCDVELLKESG